MRTFLRSKVTLLFMVLGMLIAVPAVAYAADSIITDGDLVTTGDQLSRNLGTLSPGETFTADTTATPPVPASDVKFYLDCNGANHLNSGETADLNVSATSKKDADGNTITGGTLSATSLSNFSGPSSWPSDGSAGSACNTFANALIGTSNVTIVAPKKAGTYTFAVTYTLNRDTGTASNELAMDTTQSGNTDSVTATFTFSVDNVAPANVTLTGDTAATEGNTKTYTVSGTDANEDALTYGLVQDSGTGTTTITPSKDANNVVIPGSFDVKFLTAGSVFLKASANDGTATSFSALTNVSVASANTAPVVSVTGVNGGSNYEIGSEPTPGCSVTDTEDGLNASTTAATPVVDRSALSHGLGTVSVTCSYTDGGNIPVSDTDSYTVVDTGDPTASHQLSATANGNGWNKADFTVTLNGSDTGGSGVKELHYTINGGTEQVASGASQVLNINTEGVQAISYYSVDWAGNDSATGSVTAKLDKTAPQVAYQTGSATPAANAAGWNNTNVTVTFEATDTLSGMGATDAIQTATGTATTSGEGTNVTAGSPAFTDRAGNTAAVNTATSPGFKIDKTPPVVSVTGVSNNGAYTYGNVPTPDCDTQPGLSGVKTNATVNVTGGNNGFGTFTATCSGAEDNADNTQLAPVSVQYTVSATFNGFLQPIDGHAVNTGKYGRTYPIKWQLRDSSGALISDTTAQLLVGMMSGGQKAVSCNDFALDPQDALEESTTGSTSLRYDATSDQFIYNYKAPSSGSCYVFAIRYADGLTTQQIDFKFTK